MPDFRNKVQEQLARIRKRDQQEMGWIDKDIDIDKHTEFDRIIDLAASRVHWGASWTLQHEGFTEAHTGIRANVEIRILLVHGSLKLQLGRRISSPDAAQPSLLDQVFHIGDGCHEHSPQTPGVAALMHLLAEPGVKT